MSSANVVEQYFIQIWDLFVNAPYLHFLEQIVLEVRVAQGRGRVFHLQTMHFDATK